MVNYHKKKSSQKLVKMSSSITGHFFYLLISASAFHLKSGDDIASPQRHIMKINPLMFLKCFDCQRNAHNYINNSVLRVGSE